LNERDSLEVGGEGALNNKKKGSIEKLCRDEKKKEFLKA